MLVPVLCVIARGCTFLAHMRLTGADLGFFMRGGGTDNVAGCSHPAKLGGSGGMPPQENFEI